MATGRSRSRSARFTRRKILAPSSPPSSATRKSACARRWRRSIRRGGAVHVLICGGGVIGAATAYFLSLRGVKATVIERTGLACGASGKAGGFLALDWCDGTPLQALARRSFALHAELPQRIGGDWGYRRLTTYAGVAGSRSRARHADAGWLSDRVTVGQALGSPETT